MLKPDQYLPVSLSVMGAVIATCFVLVLRKLPREGALAGARRIWLAAWASMGAHFALQSLSRAGWHALLTNDLALLMLVVSFISFSDWLVHEAWPGWEWGLRGAGGVALVWLLHYPNILPDAQGVLLGALLLAGAAAALRLGWRTPLSRWTLALSLSAWAAAMAFPPQWLFGSADFQNNFFDVFTLLAKLFCGLAMVLVVLEEQRDYLHSLFEQSPLWYHTFDAAGRITDINSEGLLWLERGKNEVVGRRMRDFCTPETLAKHPNPQLPLQQLQQGRLLPKVEIEIVTPKGRKRTVVAQSRGLYTQQGDFLGGRTMLMDLSRERQLQQELLQAQKMKAIGTLSAGVAHDINNLLTVMLGQIDWIRTSGEKTLPAPIQERLARTAESARQASDFIQNLLNFARPGKAKQERLELAPMLESFLAWIRPSLTNNIQASLQCDASLPAIYGDTDQIRQALLNLTLNAQAAMPEGGKLNLRLLAGSAPEEAAAIEVQDSGSGIAPEHLPHIFEPFYTTGETGQHSGMGLATAYAIMRAHQGRIEVESRPGEGSRFRLVFPHSTASLAADAG